MCGIIILYVFSWEAITDLRELHCLSVSQSYCVGSDFGLVDAECCHTMPSDQVSQRSHRAAVHVGYVHVTLGQLCEM